MQLRSSCWYIILQPTTRGQTRCFGINLGEFSGRPSLSQNKSIWNFLGPHIEIRFSASPHFLTRGTIRQVNEERSYLSLTVFRPRSGGGGAIVRSSVASCVTVQQKEKPQRNCLLPLPLSHSVPLDHRGQLCPSLKLLPSPICHTN